MSSSNKKSLISARDKAGVFSLVLSTMIKDMTRNPHKAAFVIATKDRPESLKTLLSSLLAQSRYPDQVIIVDASRDRSTVMDAVEKFSALNITLIFSNKPSSAGQRNMGIREADKDMSLIGFLDDDIDLDPDALEKVMAFWAEASPDIAGVSLNLANHPDLYLSSIKSNRLIERAGLYSKAKGIVLPSGFQTMIGTVEELQYSQWLPSTAVFWRREIFEDFLFDDWFSGYSYLEDLDFSYRVSRRYRLAVLPEARFRHHPSASDSFSFGYKEIANRMYFVRKYKEFSLSKCYLALFLRMIISLSLPFKEKSLRYFARVAGNLAGFVLESIKLLVPVRKRKTG